MKRMAGLRQLAVRPAHATDQQLNQTDQGASVDRRLGRELEPACLGGDHPGGDLQVMTGWIDDGERPILAPRRAHHVESLSTQWMKRVVDRDSGGAARTYGIVGGVASTPTFMPS